jgi:CheY-like chemotaxis protein
VLIVDDNRDAASSLALLLGLDGHRTVVAHDGAEALEAAERLRPDVVLLDIGLPGMSGYEVGRRMRHQPWGRGIMLIALTGWGQPEDRRRSSEAGFDAHLVKPVDHAALMALLERPHAKMSAD